MVNLNLRKKWKKQIFKIKMGKPNFQKIGNTEFSKKKKKKMKKTNFKKKWKKRIFRKLENQKFEIGLSLRLL